MMNFLWMLFSGACLVLLIPMILVLLCSIEREKLREDGVIQ